MKKIAFFLIILIVFLFFFIWNREEKYRPSKAEQLVNSILGEAGKKIKDKYNLRPCGAGAAMPGGPIQELTLCFQTKWPQTKQQLTKLLIQTAEELLDNVNKNKEIQKFIKNPPFTIKNVQIIIFNNDKSGREVYDPGISTAEISRGVLKYRTFDIIDTFKLKQELRETYEEGLRALNNVDRQ